MFIDFNQLVFCLISHSAFKVFILCFCVNSHFMPLCLMWMIHSRSTLSYTGCCLCDQRWAGLSYDLVIWILNRCVHTCMFNYNKFNWICHWTSFLETYLLFENIKKMIFNLDLITCPCKFWFFFWKLYIIYKAYSFEVLDTDHVIWNHLSYIKYFTFGLKFSLSWITCYALM